MIDLIVGPDCKESNFSWGDATPAVLGDFVVGNTIYAIRVVILTVFNGVGAALSVGVTGSPSLLMGVNECDPKMVGTYEVTPGYKLVGPATIRLYITPGAGATAGNGKIMIDY